MFRLRQSVSSTMTGTMVYNMTVKLPAALSRVESSRIGFDLAIDKDY